MFRAPIIMNLASHATIMTRKGPKSCAIDNAGLDEKYNSIIIIVYKPGLLLKSY